MAASEKRYLVAKVALSESEMAQLRDEADREGRAVAELIRRRALSPWMKPAAV